MHCWRPISISSRNLNGRNTQLAVAERARHHYITAVHYKHHTHHAVPLPGTHMSQHITVAGKSFSSGGEPKASPNKIPLSEEAKLELAREIVGVRPTDRIPRLFPTFTALLFTCFLVYEYVFVQPNLPDQPESQTPAPSGVVKVLADGRLLLDDGRIVKLDAKS